MRGVQVTVATGKVPGAGVSITGLRTRPVEAAGTLIIERTISVVAVADSRQKAHQL